MNVLSFCTQPDKNGNFLLLDIDVEKKMFAYGYHFRYANRADNVVISRYEMKKLVLQLEGCGFTRKGAN